MIQFLDSFFWFYKFNSWPFVCMIISWERNPNPLKILINTTYVKEDRHQGLEKQQSKAFLPYLQLPIRMYQDHMWPPCTLWSLQKVGSSSRSSNYYSSQCYQGCCIIDVCTNFPPEELGGAPHAVPTAVVARKRTERGCKYTVNWHVLVLLVWLPRTHTVSSQRLLTGQTDKRTYKAIYI